MRTSKLFTPVKLTGYNMRSKELTSSRCSDYIIRQKMILTAFSQGKKFFGEYLSV